MSNNCVVYFYHHSYFGAVLCFTNYFHL